AGVVMAKFAGHTVSFRRSLTLFADTPMSRSTSTRIRSGQLPRSVWSAATLFTLYCITAPSLRGSNGLPGTPTTFRWRRQAVSLAEAFSERAQTLHVATARRMALQAVDGLPAWKRAGERSVPAPNGTAYICTSRSQDHP